LQHVNINIGNSTNRNGRKTHLTPSLDRSKLISVSQGWSWSYK